MKCNHTHEIFGFAACLHCKKIIVGSAISMKKLRENFLLTSEESAYFVKNKRIKPSKNFALSYEGIRKEGYIYTGD